MRAALALTMAALAAGATAEDKSQPVPVAAPPAPSASAPAAVADGPLLYRRHCLSCHQADGGGVPNMQPAILDSAWVKGAPQALASFVLTGGFDSAARKESAVDNVMPAFPQLSDAELATLLSYVRQKFGDGAAPLSAADVAAARKNLP